MAITKLESPVTPNPATAGVGGDWDLAMAQLTACKILLQGEQAILTEMDAFLNESTTIPKIAQGTYIQHLGAIYIVDTEDYTILGSPSAGANYIQIAVSGDNLTATWITSLTGYTWSADYQGAYDASNNMILPYVVMQVTGPLYYKYNINFNHKYFGGNVESVGDLTVGGLAAITGALSAASASITGALSAGSAAITGTLSAASVNTGTALKMKVLEIGDWDMDSDSITSISISIDFTKIRSITAIVRDDADDHYYSLMNEEPGGFFLPTNARDGYIDLARKLSGFYDSTDFDSTSYNRGWVTVIYEP